MTSLNRRISEVESQRRSLTMLQSNQLALTRDQGMKLYRELLDALQQIRQLQDNPKP